MDKFLKKNIFGKVIAYVYTIEFQKRGLLHAHILIILNKDKLSDQQMIDKIVCAELSDQVIKPHM